MRSLEECHRLLAAEKADPEGAWKKRGGRVSDLTDAERRMLAEDLANTRECGEYLRLTSRK